MEAKVSEILENILGLLGFEGSFEVVEKEDDIQVAIETIDPGKLIGYRGETLDSLQLLTNLILSRQLPEGTKFKRVIIDVAGWKKGKEEDLGRKAKSWASQVKETGKEIELEPMPSWQRRIVHMVIAETKGVESESVGEGRDRHLVIRPEIKKTSRVKTGEVKPDTSKENDQLKDFDPQNLK